MLGEMFDLFDRNLIRYVLTWPWLGPELLTMSIPLADLNSNYHKYSGTSTCRSMLTIIRIHDPIGLPYRTQLRVGLSKLNFHKFKHNFRDTINPMCPTSDGIEDTEHFLLLCPSFDLQRRDLLAGIVKLLRPFVQIANLSNDALTHLLLYGDQDLSNDLNKNILKLTLCFIHDTSRFD